MKIKKIVYPTPLSNVVDIDNGNLDVFVELEDGNSYTVVITTPNNYYWYMDNEGKDYYCGCPDVIVKSLTHDNIERALSAYAENDAYWLKCYYLPGVIENRELNKIIENVFHSLESSLEST